jgi:hypothetical protein
VKPVTSAGLLSSDTNYTKHHNQAHNISSEQITVPETEKLKQNITTKYYIKNSIASPET